MRKSLEAIAIFLGLCFVSYMLTWPHWHPTEPAPPNDPVEGARGDLPTGDDVRLTGEQAVFILPYSVKVGDGPVRDTIDPTHSCMAYAGNRVRYLHHFERGKMVRLSYAGERDEPLECDESLQFDLPTPDFVKLLAGSFVMAEREREREQAIRDQLGLPP